MPPFWLLTLVLKAGVPSRFAKAASYLVAVAAFAAIAGLAVAGFHHWVSGQQQKAVELDRADISAAVANRVIEADRSANVNATVAAEIEHQNEKELDNAASGNDPVRSVLERMRAQQRAGAR